MKGSVRKRGDKWSYYFTVGRTPDGKRKIKEKGGFATKKEASTALREALRKFETEGHIVKTNTYTVSEFINYWYDNVAVTYLKYETLTQYRNVIKNHIDNEIGFIQLNKLTPIVLQEYFLKKQQQFNCNYNQKTVKVIRNVLNNVLQFAHKQNLIAVNPMKLVEFKSQQTTTKKELKVIPPNILAAVEEELKNTRYHIPYLVALHTGLRRGEVLGLTWDNIDFENNRMYVEKALQLQKGKGPVIVGTKTKSSIRNFQMTSKLKEELKKYKESMALNKEYYGEHYYKEYEFVCCNEDGSPINPSRFSTFFINLFRRLGCDYSFHDLRHTHATIMLESGINIKVIQQRLGHAEIGTTMNTYSHVTDKMEQSELKKLDEHLK